MKPQIPIIYEDEYVLAVSKPARVASVPGEGIEVWNTALGMVQEVCRVRGDEAVPYLLHRIDMQTSGLLMFGKHEKDRELLEGIFRDKNTVKKYMVLVKGIPKGNEITAKLKARESNEKIFAQTLFRVIQTFELSEMHGVVSLVEAQIKTGRKHQIRQHFAGIRCPVVMDSVYGDAAFNRKFRLAYRLGRQFLHSSFAAFVHPFLKHVVRIEAKLPMDLQSVLKRLKAKV